MSRVALARTLRLPYPRKRDVGGYTMQEAKAYNYSGGASPPSFPSNWNVMPGVGLSGQYTSMSDVVTPGYRELVARGTIVNNGMSRVSMVMTSYILSGRTVRQVKGTLGTAGGITGYRYAVYDLYGDWHALCFGKLSDGWHSALKLSYALPTSAQALLNRASIQAYNRVEPASSQTLVTVLESHKSMDMIVDRVRKLADVVQAVKNRDVRRLEFMFPGKRTKRYPKRVVVWGMQGEGPATRKAAPGKTGKTLNNKWAHPPVAPRPSKMDDASRLWLEFRYGWSPLVHDIVDSLKALYADDLRNELISRERYTARGIATYRGEITSNSVSTINWAFGTLSAKTIADHDYTVRAYILYKYGGGGALRRLNDFGAFDVPRAIWELVPWSFVIDWVIPIGDFLGALTPKVGVDILASGYEISYKMTVTRTITNWVSNPASGDLAWNDSPIPMGAADKVVMTDVSRHPHLPLPTFPPIDAKIGIKRMVDAVALLRGVR